MYLYKKKKKQEKQGGFHVRKLERCKTSRKVPWTDALDAPECLRWFVVVTIRLVERFDTREVSSI